MKMSYFLSVQSDARGIAFVGMLFGISLLLLAGSIVFTWFDAERESLRDTERISHIQKVEDALRIYQRENGTYPSTNNSWWGACPLYGGHSQSGANGWVPNLAPRYMGMLPIDPLPRGEGGCYIYRSDGDDYKLLIHLTIESIKNCPQTKPSPAIPEDHELYDPVRSDTQCTLSTFTSGARNW